MSWTLVAHTIAGSTSSLAVTTSAVDTRGADLICLCVTQYYDTAAPGWPIQTPTDSLGNNWLQAAIANSATHPANVIWYAAQPITGASHTFTFPGDGTNPYYPVVTVLAFKGSAASPLDQSNGSVQATGTTSIQPGSVTPGQNNELIVTGTSINGTETSASINSSFNETDFIAQIGGQNYSASAAYLFQGAKAAVNPTWSWTPTSTDSSSAIATFKPFISSDIDERKIQVRRPRWTAHSYPDDVIVIPVVKIEPWGFDEEQHRQERRIAWRARPEIREDIFTPPIVFKPWGFDEEQHFQIRRPRWLAHPQPDYPEQLRPTVFAGWGFDEEQHFQVRRAAWRMRPEIREDIFTAPIVFAGWGFDEEQHFQVRRAAWRQRIQPVTDDLGFRPPTVFVPWGFEEEQHFQERRVAWRMRPEIREDIFVPPVVFVGWGFDEEQHGLIRRPRWHANPQPDITDGFPFTTGQVAAYPWGFDEEQHFQLRRPRWLAHPQPDVIDGFPFTTTAPPIWYDEEQHFQIRRPSWRAHPQPGYPEQLAPTVFVPWGFEGDFGIQARRTPWRAHPQPFGEYTLISIPQSLFPPSQAWNWNGQSVLLSLQLGVVSKAWVWNPQAGTFSLVLGPPSKVWNWLGNAAVLNITTVVRGFNVMRGVMWGVVRGIMRPVETPE